MRVVLRTVAAVAMVLAGGASLASFGLPLAVAGVIAAVAALIDVERAVEQDRRAWLLVGLAAVGTLALFVTGIQLTRQ